MVKIPKELIIEKIKEKTTISDQELQTKVKDKLDQVCRSHYVTHNLVVLQLFAKSWVQFLDIF